MKLPSGWQRRLHTWNLQASQPARPLFLDKHDLAAAKLAAFRDKDRDFVGDLVEAGLLDLSILAERIEGLPDDGTRLVKERALEFVNSYRR